MSGMRELIKRAMCEHLWREWRSLTSGRRVRKCNKCGELQEYSLAGWTTPHA